MIRRSCVLTESDTGCSRFLLSSGVQQGRTLQSGGWCGADSQQNSAPLPDGSDMSDTDPRRPMPRPRAEHEKAVPHPLISGKWPGTKRPVQSAPSTAGAGPRPEHHMNTPGALTSGGGGSWLTGPKGVRLGRCGAGGGDPCPGVCVCV